MTANKETDIWGVEWDATQGHPYFRKKDPLKVPDDVTTYSIHNDNIVYQFRDEILDFIVKNGFHSLLNPFISREDILSPTIEIDDIEKIILKFLGNLKGVKNLVIFDNYIFGNSKENQSVDLFSKMIKSISSDLEKVIFVTVNKKQFHKTAESFKKALESINPHIEIEIIHSDVVHDRYWIDIDSKKGVVMGTSLNGIGKKLCLIDKLSKNDVSSILKEARKLIPSLNSHFKY